MAPLRVNRNVNYRTPPRSGHRAVVRERTPLSPASLAARNASRTRRLLADHPLPAPAPRTAAVMDGVGYGLQTPRLLRALWKAEKEALVCHRTRLSTRISNLAAHGRASFSEHTAIVHLGEIRDSEAVNNVVIRRLEEALTDRRRERIALADLGDDFHGLLLVARRMKDVSETRLMSLG